MNFYLHGELHRMSVLKSKHRRVVLAAECLNLMQHEVQKMVNLLTLAVFLECVQLTVRFTLWSKVKEVKALDSRRNGENWALRAFTLCPSRLHIYDSSVRFLSNLKPEHSYKTEKWTLYRFLGSTNRCYCFFIQENDWQAILSAVWDPAWEALGV